MNHFLLITAPVYQHRHRAPHSSAVGTTRLKTTERIMHSNLYGQSHPLKVSSASP